MSPLHTKLILILLLLVPLNLFAQSEAQIKSELDKRNISSYADVQKELSRRGMTEADARRQASLYGIDYDDYLAKYITKSNGASEGGDSLFKAVEPVSVQPVDYAIEAQDPVNKSAAPIVVEEPKSGLPYFGYSTFNSNPFSNEGLVGNIDPGYLIGPGDELRIYIWGEAEFQFEGKVDVNGNLFIPDVGQIFVSGTTYEGLLERFRSYLAKYYSGLGKDQQKVFLDVSLTKLRPIRIVMMGESKSPGSKMINAFATTLNSIYASGGVATSGSLREVRVFRKNKIISTVDLYDYLIKGALAEDLRLMNNDVVFIPARLNSISITGEVQKPGIFELKSDEGLKEIIAFASGLKPTAFAENITIRRIKDFTQRVGDDRFQREVITLNYGDLLKEGGNFELRDGDEITVGRILDKVDNQVTIAGSVFRPGDYQLQEVPQLHDLLTIAGGFKPNTYFDKFDLFRKDPNGDLRFSSFSLAEVLANPESEDNLQLQADDSVKIYSKYEFKTEDVVSIEGYVDEPVSMIWRENLSVYDLVYMSANVDELEYQNKVLTSRVDLLRYERGSTEYRVIPLNLDSILNKQVNYLLQPKDRVILYSKEINEFLNTYVTLRGAVQNEGKYELNNQMHIEDVILQAGGFLRTSLKDSATVSRENFDFSGNKISEIIRVPLDEDYLLGRKANPASGFVLQHNDYVSLDLIPGASEQRQVDITGEVKYPGTYFMTSKGETIKELIERAGGFSPNTYIPGARVFRSGQQIAIDFSKLYSGKAKKFNIVLQDRDSVFIPETTYVVQLTGEVANPSYQKFVEGQRIKKYLREAGGKTKNGRKVYVTQPNGFTYKKGFLRNPEVLDGATITVVPKPEKKPRENNDKWLQTFSIIMASLSSVALAIAAFK